jgi:hypothetical protein
MHFLGRGLALFLIPAVLTEPAASQQAIDNKVIDLEKLITTLCLVNGKKTELSTKGDVELSAKIKDVLTGKLGTAAGGGKLSLLSRPGRV